MSKSLVIITGASRGIGRAIALAISEAVAVVDKAACSSTHSSIDGQPRPLTTTTMILISRSADALQETARLVEKRGRGMITTQCHDMDLSNLDTIVDDFSSVLDGSLQYESCWLINNAGSLGPVGLASSFSSSSCGESIKELRRAVDLNLTSSIWLSSQFTKRFLTTSKSIRIVNISSLCALEPFPTMSIYCAGKAGRDMFHSVLAKEHMSVSSNDGNSSSCQPGPSFKVLNYAPGPCDTEMTDYLADDINTNLDEGIQQYFATSKREQTLIRPEDTAKKLIRILTSDEFESGSHVDYFDSDD